MRVVSKSGFKSRVGRKREFTVVDTGRKRLILNYFLKMFGIYLGMVMFAYIMPGHGAPHIFV